MKKIISLVTTFALAASTVASAATVHEAETFNRIDGKLVAGDVYKSGTVVNYAKNFSAQFKETWDLSVYLDGQKVTFGSDYLFTAQTDVIYSEYKIDMSVSPWPCGDYYLTAYTIDFKNEDGTVLQSDYCGKGNTPTYSGETPTKAAQGVTEYEFKGWDKELVAATGNTTYTATFSEKPRTFSVTLVKNGGTCDDVTSYTYGMATALPKPQKDHYTFDGWYESSSFEGDAVTKISSSDSGDKTYYAKWTFVPYAEIITSSDQENCPSIQGGIDKDGTGTIRFIWEVKLNGDAAINSLGSYVVPFDLFDSENTQSKFCGMSSIPEEIANGDTYSTDLTGIPTDYFDKQMYAIPYVNGNVILDSALQARISDFVE